MKKFLLIILYLGAFTTVAAAQNISDEQALRDLISGTNPLKEQQLNPQPPPGSEVEKKETRIGNTSEGTKFLVNRIVIQGNSIFTSDQLLTVLDASQLEGNVLYFQDIQNFADRVTAYYKRHGYVLDYAYIPVQKVNGVVTINVVEVRVGKISVVGNRWFSQQLFLNALTFKTGDYFKMADLEASLNQINAQADRYVKVYLEPGEVPGTTDITMKVTDQMPVHVSQEYNRRGSEFTGRDRYVTHVTDNNLTGRGDIIQASLALAEEKALIAEAVHYETPVPGSADVVHVDFSNGDSRFLKNKLPWDVTGKSINFIPGYTHNFIQQDGLKLDGDMRFELKDSKTDLDNVKFSFDRTRALVAGPRVTQTDAGGRTTGGFDVHVGFPNFLGSSPRNDILASRPDSGGQFVYETMDAVRIEKLPLGMYIISSASGQYSSTPLTSLEQMYLGGMYSVRGYPENDSAGDSGFSFSQELRVPFYFIPKNWKVFGMKDKTWWDSLTFAAFVDGGRVFDYDRIQNSSPKDRTLLGTGVGVNFYLSPDMNMQLDIGFPFGDQSSDKHDSQLHLSVRMGF